MYKKTTTVEEFFDTVPQQMNNVRMPHPKALKPVLRVDVPLMIRLLEYAREDATTDMELHAIVERMMELCEYGEVLEMDDYDSLISSIVAAKAKAPAKADVKPLPPLPELTIAP